MLYYCYYILVGFGEKFRIQSKLTSQGLPYDFSSIMHFRHNAFSRTGFKSTVVPRNRTIPKSVLGSSVTATYLDFLHVNLLYCGGRVHVLWSIWRSLSASMRKFHINYLIKSSDSV